MTSTWIVVAHEAGARFFENRGRGTGLELIEEVEHPEGRARDRDMASDRPGRSFRKNSGDPSRASLSQSEFSLRRQSSWDCSGLPSTVRRLSS